MADTNGVHAPTEEEQLLEGQQQEGEEEQTATNGGGEQLEGSEPAAPAKRQREEDEMEQQNLEEEEEEEEGKRSEGDAAGTTKESHPQAAEGGSKPKKQATDAGREGDADSNIAFAKAHQHTETLEVAKDVVGRIIGKGGETIRDIQTRSGCQVRTAVLLSFFTSLPPPLPPSSLRLTYQN
jgi:outer membrane biosynthesis protein TonB